MFSFLQVEAVLLNEAHKAKRAERPFQQVNSILDTAESLEDMEAKIKKAKEVKDELEQLEEAVKDLEKRTASKKKEIKSLKFSNDYLDDEQVCNVVNTV